MDKKEFDWTEGKDIGAIVRYKLDVIDYLAACDWTLLEHGENCKSYCLYKARVKNLIRDVKFILKLMEVFS